MYNLEPPAFVREPYTVAPFQVSVLDGISLQGIDRGSMYSFQ